jgi:hypothetical protein
MLAMSSFDDLLARSSGLEKKMRARSQLLSGLGQMARRVSKKLMRRMAPEHRRAFIPHTQ